MAINRLGEQRVWKDLHPKVKRGVLALKENVTVKDGKAYDAEGRDVSHVVETVIKTTEPQVRALKAVDDLSKHEVENGGFIFAFFKQARMFEERFPTLTPQDTARLMFIGSYVAWETNRLQYDNGRIIDRKGLEKLVDMSTKRFNELIRRYEAEDIIHETETGELFLNPTVFYRGDMKKHDYDISDFSYIRIFRKTIRDLYQQFKGRTLKQLALIYSVLPFLNFDTNIVCFNPQETDEDLLKPMSLDNLAALLSYQDNHKLKRALETIKVDGKPVFWLPKNVHDKREYRVIVNPRVVYGGNGKSLAGIKALFN